MLFYSNYLEQESPSRQDVVREALLRWWIGYRSAEREAGSPRNAPRVWLCSSALAAAAYFAFTESIEKTLTSDGRFAFSPFRSSNVLGFVLSSSRFAVLSVAGSNDIQDWAQNSRTDLIFLDSCSSRGIHSGFLDHGQAACEAAARTRLLEGRKVLLVGHSLGGAACLVASEFLRKFAKIDRIQGVVTFGCPRVANAEQASRFLWNAPTVQLWNVGDPIPHLPLRGCFSGYRHPPKVQRYLSAEGNLYRTRRAVWLDLAVAGLRSIGLMRKPWEIGSPIRAHSIIEYIARLARYLGEPDYV